MQERTLGFGFGALAIMWFASGATRSPQQLAAEPLEVESVTVSTAQTTMPSAGLLEDSVVTGKALLAEFFGEPLDRLAPCTRAAFCYDLDFLIVSLPDPLDSFLDHSFDSGLESMRRALESRQFVANRFWLPWDEDRKAIKDRSTHYRRNHPGVFLFRSSNPAEHRLRLVYVVGEISTGGVHKRALEAALDDRRDLLRSQRFVDTTGVRDTIRFVGPFFTGSALSTRLTVERWRRENRDTTFALFVSGAATGPGNLVVFDTSHDAIRPAKRMSFHATVNSDLALSLAMLQVVVDSLHGLGIPPDHIALIQESSTQYGQQSAAGAQAPDTAAPASRLAGTLARWARQVATATDSMLVIPYPMSIASLRAEYAKHPARAKASDELQRDAAPRIPLPLHESNQQLESPIPVAQMTPASVELTIDEIAQTLKSHDIRAIGLIGTDVRDKIFLADQLRKQLPDARLFTFGSNDLYLREEFNNSLRGMLVFSTYPLILQNQWWDSVARTRPRRFAFASDDAQGVFNATIRQLGRRGFREYRAPFDPGDSVPPVWVTAVGRHSFSPIRALQSVGGPPQYLEKRPSSSRPSATNRTAAASEPHVSQSDWVNWIMYIASAATLLGLVLFDDAKSRRRVPIDKPRLLT